MELRFLALQGLQKNLSILPDAHSLFTIHYSSSIQQLSARSQITLLLHTSRQQSRAWQHCHDSHCDSINYCFCRMHLQRNLTLLIDLILLSSSMKTVQNLTL